MSQQSPLGTSVFKALGLPEENSVSDAENNNESRSVCDTSEHDENHSQEKSDTSILIQQTTTYNGDLNTPSEIERSPLIYDQLPKEDLKGDDGLQFSDHESDSEGATSYQVKTHTILSNLFILSFVLLQFDINISG